MSSVSAEDVTVINTKGADFITVNDSGAIAWFEEVDQEHNQLAPITSAGEPLNKDDLEWPLESTVTDLNNSGIEVIEHPSL